METKDTAMDTANWIALGVFAHLIITNLKPDLSYYDRRPHCLTTSNSAIFSILHKRCWFLWLGEMPQRHLQDWIQHVYYVYYMISTFIPPLQAQHVQLDESTQCFAASNEGLPLVVEENSPI
jgi:hypothetical protein